MPSPACAVEQTVIAVSRCNGNQAMELAPGKPWQLASNACSACSIPCKGNATKTSAAASPGQQLEDLQPDVLFQVLLLLKQQDVVSLKLCSTRIKANILQASQHWAPKVESWLSCDPNTAGLLQRLRKADCSSLAAAECQMQPPVVLQPTQHATADAATHLQQGSISSAVQLIKQHCMQQCAQGDDAIVSEAQVAKSSLALATNPFFKLGPNRLDWLQVWTCLLRAQNGPWQLNVQQVSPAVASHGVLLTFELLLEQPAPMSQAQGGLEQRRDHVPILSFVLDGKAVDIVVDASGRVTSPQRDWAQGCIQLQPGQPRLLALEVSYIFPAPAWYLHPCTLAAPKPALSTVGCKSSMSTSGSMSSMLTEQAWDSRSMATCNTAASSLALCSAIPVSDADSCSLATSSLTSSSSFSSGSSGSPRLVLDLSVGFGCYVTDPRYADESKAHAGHRGLERIELANKVCWRPSSKVQTWLGRLLPGIRGHASQCGAGMAAYSSVVADVGHSSSQVAASGPVSAASSGLKAVGKPSFVVTLNKAAAWQVPEDTDRRFTEGFMFWAVHHKFEQQLMQYGILAAT